jgi:DNA uptake protein ComE-like DNA-binding protein
LAAGFIQDQHMKTYTASALLVLGTLLASAPAAADQPVLVVQAKSVQIDINRAKADELMLLKGIGEARAEAIIKGRPYARKDELVKKKILPESVYNEIKDLIVAKQ